MTNHSSPVTDDALIENAPEPLLRLGGCLAAVLDDDNWNRIEPILIEVAKLFNAPAQRLPDRKTIAKIIDPDAKLDDIEGVVWSKFTVQQRELAYQKADAVLALTSTDGGGK